jgi:hypothetical protein
MMIQRKGGAIELSMTTIIVVVLSLTLLIMGFVFVRSIMCGAIGLSGSINEQTQSQINDLFSASGGEIQCFGDGSTPLKIASGSTFEVGCKFDAEETTHYRAEVTIDQDGSTILRKGVTLAELQTWIPVKRFEGDVTTSDNDAKRIALFDLPDDAPEGDISLKVKFYKRLLSDPLNHERLLREKTLNFIPKQNGAIEGFIC